MAYHPLTKDRWQDFESLFGPKGAYGGCWCMWWRTTRSQFEKQQGGGNRASMKNLVNAGTVPGILLYKDKKPVAWCSVAPRRQFASLNRSPVLKPLDDAPVWSIVCFYVAKGHRKQGILEELIRAAINYVREAGGRIVEAYPTLPKQDGARLPPVSSFMGMPSVFERVGFVACGHPSKSKVIMRYHVTYDPPPVDVNAAESA